MRKLQKILLGVFLGGVLLGGIGTGVAFVEYSSITYAGEKKIGQESVVTKDLDFSFDPGKGIVNIDPVWYDDGNVSHVETDGTVPEDVIRYRVTYNEKAVVPHLYFSKYDEDDQEDDQGNDQGNDQEDDQGKIYLELNYRDEFGLWMENKDEILRDLKQGRIASYRAGEIVDVKVLVNPASADYIKQEGCH